MSSKNNNPGQNIWNKVKKSSKIGQKQKTLRSSRPEVLLRKGVLKICSKFLRRTPMPKCDFNKVALLTLITASA